MISQNMIEIYLWVISLSVLVFLVDDLFIDIVAYVKKLKPRAITKNVLFDAKNKKMLAIMVANWKEEAVLEAMVKGNMANLPLENVHLFLGVYPNDTATREIAERMERIYPRVHAVVNTKEGPTYKGQMLNEIIKKIFVVEEELKMEFEGFILHDSEDILDPNIPYLYSLGLRQADFIQTPVFSLPVNWWELTAGTYMDEFAEIHSKDLLVRQYLGAALPSAGVGTCISRRLILTFLSKQNGEVFLPDSLTEDYQLGLQTTQWGFKSTFLCHYVEDTDYSRIISTREFFPHMFWQSIRQKTRWTTGIAFQGMKNIGWFGNFWQRYFLWRDRKGPLNAFLTANLIFTLCLLPLSFMDFYPNNKYLQAVLLLNTIGMFFRFAVRIHCVKRIYGKARAFSAILRWPAAMVINMWSGMRSTKQYIESQITGKKIKWVKTEHRLPEGFGQIADAVTNTIQQVTTDKNNNVRP
jgi:adsorption protein B